ncbi:MAG: carboxymuconolactone decarboxylase family protein, partial [Candidatus Binatia bacterium]
MARVPLPEAVTDAVRSYGVLAHEPRLLRRFLDLYGRLWRDGIVDHPTKEVVRLRNARITGCGYCRNVRFAVARQDGLGEDQVAMIDEGYDASSLSPRHKAA